MPGRTKKQTKKRYPSRDAYKYIPIKVADWERLKERAVAKQRSVAFMGQLAVKRFLG